MRRIPVGISLFVIIFIASCTRSAQQLPVSPANAATATLSSIQVQTQISAMLTMMPSATVVVPAAATPTKGLPTLDIGGAAVTTTPEVQPPAATETEAAPADTPAPTATAASTVEPQAPTVTISVEDPRSRLGAPDSTDPMDNPDNWVWPTGTDQFSSAFFANGTQAITSRDTKDGWRMANPLGRAFTNTYIEATFKIGACSGRDHYGIILRVPEVSEPDQGYLFGLSCDGAYSLRRWNGEILPKGEMKKLVDWTASSAINSGSNQVNRLGILAVGNRLALYANGKYLTEVQDNSYSTGYFGVFIGQVATQDFSVQLDEMSYWENPQP